MNPNGTASHEDTKSYLALKRYCLSLTKTSWDAEDLAQNAWLKAYAYLKQTPSDLPEALMIRMAKHSWIDQVRRQNVLKRVLHKHETEAKTVQQTEAGVSSELEILFHGLIRHLSPLQRGVFLLRDVFSYSAAETALRLGTSTGAVKAALHRARQALPLVRKEWETGSLPAAKDEDTKSFIRALASAYTNGHIQSLVTLVMNDGVDAAAAVTRVQQEASQAGKLRSSGIGGTTAPKMAA
ncbi:sigma-70 family RNA polymerase sigma factor [Paenibacillus gansuensis]|uniref:Sigma-70 family RNA polymerase sigma factor n=1 Tax=Paenibacillus gansuensis TaxID=306542 RepID=A0ABW5P6Z4_9BACL